MKLSSLFKKDGWINVLKGLGGKSDATGNTFFGEFEILDDEELTRMWMGEGMGKKIVSVVADDMTRNWIDIPEDGNNKIMKELARLEAKTLMNEALKWARLYRGSVVILGLDDGGKLEEPVNKSVKSIDWMKVYPAPRIMNQETDVVTDPKSKYFEEFEIFKIQKINGTEIKVHTSRCLVFKGDPVPNNIQNIGFNYLYWGNSILQSIWNQLKNYGGVEQSVVNLMYEAVIGKYTLSGLAEMLSEGKTTEILERMELINAGKSIFNGVILGEDEDYIRDNANVSGIAELMDRFMMSLSAVSEIPVTRLFGRSPAGENATGDSDNRIYYDMVGSKQETWLGPPLQQLVNLINIYMKVRAEPMIVFNNVWEPSQAELITMRKEQMETDIGYINTGVLSPEAVTESRFANGYSFETDVEDMEMPEKPDVEEPVVEE